MFLQNFCHSESPSANLFLVSETFQGHILRDIVALSLMEYGRQIAFDVGRNILCPRKICPESFFFKDPRMWEPKLPYTSIDRGGGRPGPLKNLLKIKDLSGQKMR